MLRQEFARMPVPGCSPRPTRWSRAPAASRCSSCSPAPTCGSSASTPRPCSASLRPCPSSAASTPTCSSTCPSSSSPRPPAHRRRRPRHPGRGPGHQHAHRRVDIAKFNDEPGDGQRYDIRVKAGGQLHPAGRSFQDLPAQQGRRDGAPRQRGQLPRNPGAGGGRALRPAVRHHLLRHPHPAAGEGRRAGRPPPPPRCCPPATRCA